MLKKKRATITLKFPYSTKNILFKRKQKKKKKIKTFRQVGPEKTFHQHAFNTTYSKGLSPGKTKRKEKRKEGRQVTRSYK